jgi:hypothetical protein
MKSISAILGIYILALAVLPCADEANWCIFDVEETFGVELHESGNHNHENECSDHCSPLCTCSCCHITIRTPTKNDLSITGPKFIFADYPLLSMLIDLTSINDIWQPPQLS